MRMSDRARPTGMAHGNEMATMAMASRKPLNTTGMLLTMSDGLKNRRRNLLEFHAFTQSCSSRLFASWSVADTVTTLMGSASNGRVVPSWRVYVPESGIAPPWAGKKTS